MRGEIVDDFEGDVGSRWNVLGGKFSLDKQTPYRGTQSLALHTTDKKGYTDGGLPVDAGVVRSFDEDGGLDLRNHDLSMAIKFEQPVHGQIAVDLLAPTSDHRLGSLHPIPPFFNGWTRIDLGYTGKQGNPTMKSVQAIRIMYQSGGDRPTTPVTITIDEIRKRPKPDTGKVTLLFDSQPGTYEEIFPKLKQRDWQGGVVDVVPSIHKPDNMTTEHMRTMRDAGWDMMSRPPAPKTKTFTELPLNEQEKRIRQSKRSLERKGFPKGARHIVAPGPISKKTTEIIQKYHETNYVVGKTPNNAYQPSNMYDISYMTVRAVSAELQSIASIPFYLAEEFGQMISLAYVPEKTSIDAFEEHLAIIEKKDVEVVSPSQFLDSIGT